MTRDAIEPGAVFTTVAPFTRQNIEFLDVDGPTEISGWRPGARAGYGGAPDDPALLANAEGAVEYRVVSIHQPPGFQTRVFYCRVFITPSGFRMNGRKSRALRVTGIARFRKIICRWPVEYEVDADAVEAAS